jgi:uncharacterized protein (TIGR02611 family)
LNPYGWLVQPDRSQQDEPAQPVAVPPEHREQDPGPLARVTLGARRVRAWVHARPGGVTAWRAGVALTGLVVIVVGIVLLAAPGPGWLVIFGGLGIWATEFAWAESLLKHVRRTVAAWAAWMKHQPRWLAVLVGACGVVLLAAVVWGAWTLVR